MFRSYTGTLCFLIEYLRISVIFLLPKTILATVNEHRIIEPIFFKTFSSKLFDIKLSVNLYSVECY